RTGRGRPGAAGTGSGAGNVTAAATWAAARAGTRPGAGRCAARWTWCATRPPSCTRTRAAICSWIRGRRATLTARWSTIRRRCAARADAVGAPRVDAGWEVTLAPAKAKPGAREARETHGTAQAVHARSGAVETVAYTAQAGAAGKMIAKVGGERLTIADLDAE